MPKKPVLLPVILLAILPAILAMVLAAGGCGSAPVAKTQYRSPAGYTISYPSTWKVSTSGPTTFGASAPDRREYLVVIVLDRAVDLVVQSHQDQLQRVSERTESRPAGTASAGAPELWSRRTESDGRVGIYQQYFFATPTGTVWVQHGCFEPGPDVNEAADRDCDDAGLAIAGSLHLEP